MKLVPNVSMDEGIPTITFEAMPFWEGVQKCRVSGKSTIFVNGGNWKSYQPDYF